MKRETKKRGIDFCVLRAPLSLGGKVDIFTVHSKTYFCDCDIFQLSIVSEFCKIKVVHVKVLERLQVQWGKQAKSNKIRKFEMIQKQRFLNFPNLNYKQIRKELFLHFLVSVIRHIAKTNSISKMFSELNANLFYVMLIYFLSHLKRRQFQSKVYSW